MRFVRFVVVCLAVAVARGASADPLLITTSSNAAALAANLAGPGITIVGGSELLIGASAQQGTFTGGTGILPFDTGILLTTANALLAPGPNTSESAGDVSGSGANAALTAISGFPTFDQNVLSFDFIPTSNVISFQFVFASEEYHEYVNTQFNDVFAFFLNGTNIALVPGTLSPITINTINCGSNSGFYAANSGTSPCFNPLQAVNTQYDGLAGGLFVLPLFATGPVNANVSNTMELAIADAGDARLDSAVFLKENSFVPEPPPTTVPEPASITLLGVGLAGIVARRYGRRHLPQPADQTMPALGFRSKGLAVRLDGENDEHSLPEHHHPGARVTLLGSCDFGATRQDQTRRQGDNRCLQQPQRTVQH